MNRFKKYLSFFIALVLMLGTVSLPVVNVSAATVEVEYTGERKINFNEDWRFRLLDTARAINNTLDSTAGALDFDDTGSSWSDVELPHDWSIYQPYGSGAQRAAQGALPGGTGWYRKSFTIPDDFKGKTIMIQFDGVQMVSEVWINGVRNTAEWKQYLGYVTFEYDITDHLLFDGQKNTIAVKCYSSPNSARWYPGAGIYRNVWLIATEPVYVPVNGVKITTPREGLVPSYPLYQPMENPTSAQVDIETKLNNDTAEGKTVSLKSTVYNKAGNVVDITTDEIDVPANGTYKVSQTVNVPDPKLWSTDSPNLYWVKTEVISGGTVVDTIDSRFGIRYTDLNPNTGFYLNGVSMKLQGMCEHSDLGPLGMETYQAAIDRRIRKLKDMGCNAIRTAHNPVSPEYIEACDRLGMMLMEEAFDQWDRAKNADDYSNYFAKSTTDGTTRVFTVSTSSSEVTINRPDLTSNAERDIKAMVDRDKNSPAVIMWSTGNEIDDHKYSYSPNVSKMLSGWIHEIDETRPTIAVPPWWDNAGGQFNNYMRSMAAADIGGFNYATDYYDRGHNEYPTQNLVGAETCSAFATRGYYAPEYYGVRVPGNRGSTYMCNEYPGETNFELANKSFVGVRDRDFIMGEFVWTGHDYLGEPTPHGGNAMSSSFGILDTCGFEKDAFYLYKSNWTDDPTCHLLPQNWTQWTLGQQIPVVVYTNGRFVDLYLNGVLIGTKTFDKKTANPVYVEFGSIPFAPGELKAVAKDINGNVIATDVVYTAGAATNVDLVGDRAFIENDGRDLVFVEATIRDSAGVMAPTASNRVTVSVTGGRIIATGNGSHIDRESQRGSDNRLAFNGKALFIIAADKGYTGDITITSTSPGLTSNTIVVGAVPEISGDGTGVLDYEKPEITVGIGMTPEMPKNIRVMLDNGLMRDISVSSWDMSEVNLNTPGNYTAYGTADGISDAIECLIHVKSINAVEDISVTTIAGVYPPLPKFVTIHYTDGEIGATPVTWDAVEPSQYAGSNQFTVLGKLGPALTITAHVTVKQVVSVQDITVQTTAGKAPDMPAGVPVQFNDGSTETLSVDWTLTPSDYEYPGTSKVTGKVLGSSITAKATIQVQSMVYLSDLDWTGTTGTVVKDKTIGGNTLKARGVFGGPPVEYQKGLGTLADAEIVYDIAGMGYDVFQAYVSLGLDDGGMTAHGAVAFEVYLDGVLSFESGRMDRQNEAILIDLDVTGVSTLRLVSKAVGTDGAEYDLADWCDAKFLSNNIVVGEATLPKQLYLNNISQVPTLPNTAQVSVPGGGTASFKIEWPPLTPSLFSAAGVQPVYGRLAGTANGVVLVKVITDYNAARTASDFSEKVGRWSEVETFDFNNIASGAKVNLSNLTVTPRLIHSQSNMLVENVQAYGFQYGLYPISTGSNNRVVFATPNLTYFQLLNVASTTAISSSGNFTIETSPDNSTWTAFTDFTKSDVLPGTGTTSVWPQRTYTSNNSSIPAGTNFLRVTYPSGNTWQFNITKAIFRGGSATSVYDNDLAFFRLGGYDGLINQDEQTVTVTVPDNLNVTNIAPEVSVSQGATYSPKGAQDFTNPVTYTVSNGDATKTYTVTVKRGSLVSFNLYGGTISGSTDSIVSLVHNGGFAQAPAASPARKGYLFKGWTTDRSSTTPMTVGSIAITKNTTFFAIWEKDPWIEVTASADVGMKTWQGEKNTNYGGDTTMLMRRPGNSASYGQFGENFTNTSTSDSTDIKTSLVRFDIEQFKALNIKSAQLVLWYQSVGNGTAATNFRVLATRASSNWGEKQVTWNTKPAYYVSEGTAQSNQIASSATGTALTTDVTSFYNAVPSDENQLSIALTVDASTADYSFTTREGASANPSRAPRLRFEVDVAPDYMITYDLNGGSGNAPIQPTLEAGMTFAAVRALDLTGPAGKLFKEWNTKADGNGTSYNPGDIVTMPEKDLTLYAIWVDATAMIATYDTFLDRVGIVTVRSLEPDNTVLVLAAYDDNGAVKSVSEYPLDANGGQEQDIITGFNYAGAASVRAFLWSKEFLPMSELKEIYKK